MCLLSSTVNLLTDSVAFPVAVSRNETCIHVHVIYTVYIMNDFCCVCLTDNTGSAGKLFPDTGGPGFGIPASPQRPGHSSALPCSP